MESDGKSRLVPHIDVLRRRRSTTAIDTTTDTLCHPEELDP